MYTTQLQHSSLTARAAAQQCATNPVVQHVHFQAHTLPPIDMHTCTCQACVPCHAYAQPSTCTADTAAPVCLLFTCRGCLLLQEKQDKDSYEQPKKYYKEEQVGCICAGGSM